MKPKRKSSAGSTAAPRDEGALRLVPVTRSDFDVWRAMRADLYTGIDPAYNEAEMTHILGSPDFVCLLVRAANGDAVGFVEASLRNVVDGCLGGPVGYIEGLYLAPAWRGIGLGPAIVEAAAEWFRAQGCAHMATDAELENEEAQDFWSGLGFEETWRIVQYRKALGSPAADKTRAKRKAAKKRGKTARRKSRR